jgi:Protein of unknown function (DUF4012)
MENNQKPLPILIIDKHGTMGADLAGKLQEQFLIVLVSSELKDAHKNTIHIPYRKKIPLIPDNSYSHIFVFYNGEEEVLDILPPLMKKAHDSRGKLLFITSLFYSSKSLFVRLSHHVYHTMQILLYGELFSRDGHDDNMVTYLISQAKKGRVTLPHNGIGNLYPVLQSDVLDAFVTIAFTTDTSKRILFVFPRHPVSELTVGRILQKMNPMLKIDFTKSKGKLQDYYMPADGYYFFAAYPFEVKLREVTSDMIIEESSQKVTKAPKIPKRRPSESYALPIILICLFIAPLLGVFVLVGVGLGTLQLSVTAAEDGKLTDAYRLASVAQGSLATASTIGDSLVYLDVVASKPKEEAMHKLGVIEDVAETEVTILSSAKKLQEVADGTSEDSKQTFFQSVADLKNALVTLQKLKAEGDLPKSITGKLDDMESLLVPFANTVDTLPELLGFEGKRTYLVLFQNNMEIRPGGGFIGSYGIAELENGRVNSFTVHDVYDADGKLTGHVDPPFALRRYLGASHGFLRDSNFSIDFTQDAVSAMSFLQMETGQKVNGVIGVDTNFLRSLLTVTGPIKVQDYNETVTPDNFYLLTQTHAEKDFFPGSTQKKDFLRSLLTAITEKLKTDKDISKTQIVKKVGESIAGKHILFAFPDQSLQKLFTVNNLSSSLWDGRVKGENGFLDFFGVIDANLGANKSNYYIKRTIEQSAAISDKGDMTSTATVTYTNTSTAASPFGGNYKNYVRFVLPANATVDQVKIDNQVKPTVDAITDPSLYKAPGFVPPQELEVEKTTEQGKTVVGFLVVVPVGQSKRVSLTYSVPDVVNTNEPTFTYNLKIFKQPGTQDDPYALFLTYPSTFRLVQSDKGLSDVGGKLAYSVYLTGDKDIKATFSKR